MMHECPRCGFVQPKDRYCANCGLDIDNFKPAPKPFMRRLGESTAFQVTFAILIVLGLGGWIYWSQKQAIDEQLGAALQIASPNTAAVNTEDSMPVEAPVAIATPTAAPSPTNSPQALATNTTQRGNQRTPFAGAKEFNVQFLEMSRLYLQQLAQDHQVVDETAQTRSIIMTSQPNVANFRDRDPQAMILPGGDTHSIRAGRTITLDFMQMIGGPSDVAGMNLEITPNQVLEQSVEFTVNGTVTLRTPEGGYANYGFDGRFTLPNTATLIVSGIVPHQPTRPEDQENFAGTPLVILSSPEFGNHTSELVLVIQPK